jgi:hypothetical protein
MRKAKLFLCVIKRGVEVKLHAFLTSQQDGVEWSDSLPGRFTPGETAPETHCVGGSVGPRNGPDVGARRRISAGARNRTPVVQPVI